MVYPSQGERVRIPFRMPVDLVEWLHHARGIGPGHTQNDLVIRALRMLREQMEGGATDLVGDALSAALADVDRDLTLGLPPVTPEWRRPHRKTG